MEPMLLLAVADKDEVFDVVVYSSVAMWLLLVVALITSFFAVVIAGFVAVVSSAL